MSSASWLGAEDGIAKDARDKGITCDIDISDPSANHCYFRQFTHYSELRPDMDVHYLSGPLDLAFYRASMALGGNSCETSLQIWWLAIKSAGPRPNLTMSEFADLTRKAALTCLKIGGTRAFETVDEAWNSVGLPAQVKLGRTITVKLRPGFPKR
jgi:Zn-dependent metalloprotease